MANPRGWNGVSWALALSLSFWLGCEREADLSLPPSEPQAVSETVATVPPVPVQERHCELILLNPSPTPVAEAANGAAPPSAPLASDPSQEPPGVKEFRRLHREIPPAVVRALRDNHFRNYSVHIAQIRDDYYAVRYYEYVGQDYAVDMASLEHDPDYRQWRNQWEACQVTMLPLSDNQWWAPLKEIGHID